MGAVTRRDVLWIVAGIGIGLLLARAFTQPKTMVVLDAPACVQVRP